MRARHPCTGNRYRYSYCAFVTYRYLGITQGWVKFPLVSSREHVHTMGLVEADLDWGPGVHVSMGTFRTPSQAPIQDHLLDAWREPAALEGWILQVLCCDPKGGRAFLRILST